MVRHRDDDPEDAGGVAVDADKGFHVAAAALAGWEGGGYGGADGGFGVFGTGGEEGYYVEGLGWHDGGGGEEVSMDCWGVEYGCRRGGANVRESVCVCVKVWGEQREDSRK